MDSAQDALIEDPKVIRKRALSAAANKRYRQRHPERHRASVRRYRNQHKGKLAAQKRTADLVCPACQKPFRGDKRSTYCSRSCATTYAWTTGKHNLDTRKGSGHPGWKGGRCINKQGYIEVWVPPETPGRVSGGRMREHRLVMQQHLGRPLKPYEHVHHKNGDKQDNRIANLEIMTKTPHRGVVECPHCGKAFTIR